MSPTTGDGASVILWQIPYRVGSCVRVYTVPGGYSLANGLPEAAQVVVMAIEAGSRVVEFEGRHFEVPQACVDFGFKVITNRS